MFWEALFELSPMPLLLVGPSGALQAVNAAWQRMLGVSDQVVAEVVFNGYNALEDEQLQRLGIVAIIRRALAGHRVSHHVIHYDAAAHTAGGRARHLEATLTPLGQGAAFTGCVLVGFQDVSDREEARQAARQKDLMLRSVIDHSPALIFVKDLDGRYVLANAAISEVFATASIEGRSDAELLPAEAAAAVAAWDRQVVAGGVPQRIEETIATPVGQRHYLTAKFPMHDAAGNIVGVGGVSHDVTDQVAVRRDNERLQVSERAAREASKLKSEFLATISHEIRTPLAGIIGLAQLLADTQLTAAQHRHLSSLVGAAHMLLRVLNDILDLSKLEAKRISLEPRPFDLRAMVESARATLAPTAEGKGLKVTCHIAEAVEQTVLGDAARIGQVLLNLVNNAVKFSDRGTITLRVSRPAAPVHPGGAPLRFAVADEGIGIDPRDQKKLFQSFSQADASIARRFGGTGLGLAICRAIVEAMGGRIGVDSAPGVGSLFWFEVPAPGARKQAGEGAPGAGGGAPGAPVLPPLCGRVLLAEDNAVNQTVALHLLNKMGLSADVVADGAAAVALAQRQRYDAILMDCHMPGSDGFAATGAIRRSQDSRIAKVPIVAVTANSLAGDMEACLAAGMDDYLAKPVTFDALYACLRRHLAVAKP